MESYILYGSLALAFLAIRIFLYTQFQIEQDD